MASIELSLVTTGYNEADEIGENLLAMKKALDEYTGKAWELIFVKDGSTKCLGFKVGELPATLTWLVKK